NRVLFPPDQRFIDQKLAGRRQVQAPGTDLFELFPVISDTAAGTTHGERGADNAGEAKFLGYFQRFFQAMDDFGARAFQADVLHGRIKAAAVFRLVDGIFVGADELYSELFQNAIAVQLQSTVKRRLATHSGQDRIGALLGDDVAHRLPGDGLDVGGVRHGRVGHYGCRVGVHENDPVALFPQSLTRLRPGIVELTRLADNNGAGPNDKDGLNIGSFW